MPVNGEAFVPVIVCGGSGSRLWPLSRAQKSKPFVDLPTGDTMIGHLLDSLPALGCDAVVFVTSREQLEGVQSAASQIDIPSSVVCEPMGRGTAPALAVAMSVIARDFGKGAVFAMLPADHHVGARDRFNDALRNAAETARNAGRLVVLGIEPTSAATRYGYIKAGAADGKGFVVDSFVEKPQAEVARRMLRQGGHYWNAGVFVASLQTMDREFERHVPDLAKAKGSLDPGEKRDDGVWMIAKEDYASFPSVSIDVAVAERTDNASVIPVSESGWSDLGDWSDFMALAKPDSNGNRAVGDVVMAGTKDSCVYAAAGRKVALAGCDGAIVADMPDALLVTSPGSGESVREVHNNLVEAGERSVEFPSVEKRPWGSYRQLGIGPGWQAKRIEVEPGKRLSLQSHKHRSEHWTVVAGIMRVSIDGRDFDLKANESCYVPLGARHRMANLGDEPAVLIEVQCGDYLGEDDIVRYEDDFGRS